MWDILQDPSYTEPYIRRLSIHLKGLKSHILPLIKMKMNGVLYSRRNQKHVEIIQPGFKDVTRKIGKHCKMNRVEIQQVQKPGMQ